VTLSAAVLAAVLSLPICAKDRQDARKPDQLRTIASAITTAATETRWRRGPADLAAHLTTIAYHESRLCIHVTTGEHRGPAVTNWQIEGQFRRLADKFHGPFIGLGIEPVTNAARVAAHILSKSFQCGSSPGALYSAYAGRACQTDWPTLRQRVQTYKWISFIIESELSKQRETES
jgi:hypothetical protein